MISFPNAKINLGLNVVRKRADGYHDLETVFFPVPIHDALEIVRSDTFNFTSSGLNIDGPPEQNLCVKAYTVLQTNFPRLPPVKVHLHKNIPMGAGIGGGSADAAQMLMMLNDKFQLNIETEELMSYALRLGSDCPFFVHNKPCFATGRGEKLEPVTLDLSGYRIAVVNPRICISTRLAFAELTPVVPVKSIKEIVNEPVESWKEELKNDFESFVFRNYPEVERVKHILYEHGATYASMSGSGSSVYGLFKQLDADLIAVFREYKVFIV